MRTWSICISGKSVLWAGGQNYSIKLLLLSLSNRTKILSSESTCASECFLPLKFDFLPE